ncbi:PKD domain protein [uncultured Lacinutrix sp.]|uniref:PKD domain protein n=1 Tax=uncultured Lacinutrix sp. TaxID=574032 RepID=UPI00261D949C|nr:PKD domain protein [uncultured Lacinutrix sp.]
MKNLKYILSLFLVITAFVSCVQEDDIPDVSTLPAPTNVAAVITIDQDNSGLVTITPTGENVANFRVNYGDGSGEDSGVLNPGESAQHTYQEGSYEIVIAASSINGKTTTVAQTIVVSFQAPENLIVTIENDAAISKQVNVMATADFAISYEVNFGDPAETVMMSNIDEIVSFTYVDAGVYTITVTAFSGSVDTISYSEDFEVTEILAPLVAAPTAPARQPEDVISIYSAAYTDIAGTDFYPDWGQQTVFEEVDVAGDLVIKYGNLNYQGIQYGETIDASAMETLHIDVWTADATQVEIYPISAASGEQQVTKTLNPSEWNSFDIPLSDFTDQGLTINDLIQFKFVGSGTIFLDNIYYYKAPSTAGGTTCEVLQDFEGAAPAFTSFGNIADTQAVANPDMSGVNTTANVAQFTKTAGSEVWAGTFFDLASVLDLSSCNQISIKTWSPKLGATVRFKIENSADNSQFYETDLTTTTINEWETLVFDVSAASAFNYDRIVIFFDFGVAGDDSLYYFDEVELVSSGGTGGGSLGFQDFEGTAPTFVTFGNMADIQVIANPDMSGINTTGNVAEFSKTGGSEVWAGGFFDTASPLDLTTYNKISIKTWSPKNGAVVRLKIENSADDSQFFEVDMSTTTTNTWEELEFDVSSAQAFNYDRVVMFFDFGVAGDDSVYYYDELELKN